MKRKRQFIIIIGIILIIFSAKLSWCASFYVSKYGNNANGSSWSTAWNELNKINWSVVNPGDTIFIDGGASSMEYVTGTVVGVNGSSGNVITIKRSTESGHNGTVIIAPSSGTVFNITNRYHIKFDGIDKNKFILNGQKGCDKGFASENSGNSHNIEIANVTIRQMDIMGIHLRNYSSGYNIHHVEIYECGSGSSDGAVTTEYDISASGNFFHHSIVHDGPAGMKADNFSGMSGFDIYNNTIYQSLDGSSSCDNLYITGSNVRIYNNLIYANGSNQYIYVFTGNEGQLSPSNIKIYNNIFWKSSPSDYGFGVYVSSKGGGGTISNVKIYNNTFHNLGYPIFIKSDGTTSYLKSIDIKNNIFNCGGSYYSGGCVRFEGSQATSNTTLNYNFYDSNSDGYPAVVYWSGSNLTLAELKSLHSQELNGGSGNPQYNSISSTGLRLTDKTPFPCNNGGINLSDTFNHDKDGNARPASGSWDMGAYIAGVNDEPQLEASIPSPPANLRIQF